MQNLVEKGITMSNNQEGTRSPVDAPTFDDMVEQDLIGFLERVGQGKVSGTFEEWPQLKPACRYAAKKLRAAALVARSPVGGETSDGYHTFNELYEHRHALFAVACSFLGGWKSKLHDDGTMFPGWFIAGLTTSEGVATYHLPIRLWGWFPGRELDKAPKWDGHTPADVVDRLWAHVEALMAARPAEPREAEQSPNPSNLPNSSEAPQGNSRLTAGRCHYCHGLSFTPSSIDPRQPECPVCQGQAQAPGNSTRDAVLSEMENVPWAVSIHTVREWAKRIRSSLQGQGAAPASRAYEVTFSDGCEYYGSIGLFARREDAEEVAEHGRAKETDSGVQWSIEEREIQGAPTQGQASSGGGDCVEALRALRDLMECPRWVDKATVPRAGIDARPEQVVFNMSVAYLKIKRAQEVVNRVSYPPDALHSSQPGPGVREALDNLIGAMDAWGSWKDGIPAEFASVIADARRVLAGLPQAPKDPDPSAGREGVGPSARSGIREPSALVMREGEVSECWVLVNECGSVTSPRPSKPGPGDPFQNNKQWRWQKFKAVSESAQPTGEASEPEQSIVTPELPTKVEPPEEKGGAQP